MQAITADIIDDISYADRPNISSASNRHAASLCAVFFLNFQHRQHVRVLADIPETAFHGGGAV